MVASFAYGYFIIIGHSHAQYVKAVQSKPLIGLYKVIATRYLLKIRGYTHVIIRVGCHSHQTADAYG